MQLYPNILNIQYSEFVKLNLSNSTLEHLFYVCIVEMYPVHNINIFCETRYKI